MPDVLRCVCADRLWGYCVRGEWTGGSLERNVRTWNEAIEAYARMEAYLKRVAPIATCLRMILERPNPSCRVHGWTVIAGNSAYVF